MATTPAIDMTTETIIGTSTNAGNGITRIESVFNPLVAATGTDTATVPWVSALGYESICVYVDITTSGTLNIVGSNLAAPVITDNGFAIATAITADGFATVTTEKIPRWWKVYPSASGGAMTVSVKVKKIAMDKQ